MRTQVMVHQCKDKLTQATKKQASFTLKPENQEKFTKKVKALKVQSRQTEEALCQD